MWWFLGIRASNDTLGWILYIEDVIIRHGISWRMHKKESELCQLAILFLLQYNLLNKDVVIIV